MNKSKLKKEITDIFFLGAGKPKLGEKPSALKEIGASSCALDWQLHSLELLGKTKINFLGGYHVEKVIRKYPNLNYTVIPDWESKSILNTFLNAPLRNVSTLVTYADTIFRKDDIYKVSESKADVTLLYDSNWKKRYEKRREDDLLSAEVIYLVNGEYCSSRSHKTKSKSAAEFTGVVKFSPSAIKFISTIIDNSIGDTLLDLIDYLYQQKFIINAIDVNGNWTEFNSPCDVSQFILGTKAETLSRLAPLLTKSCIGEQISFTASDWRVNKSKITAQVNKIFKGKPLIVRSSSKDEDNWSFSNAGIYNSFLNVDGNSNSSIEKAVESVISSYIDADNSYEDQILVQELIQDVQYSGVVFTCSMETGAPYYRFNFDDHSGATNSVTSGLIGDFRTILVIRDGVQHLTFVEPKLIRLFNAIKEIEEILGYDKLDIEFAVDKADVIHIFQIRPITVGHTEFEIEKTTIKESIENAFIKYNRFQKNTPFILGSKTFFGNMPDWNPAEIIGIRPKPLAFSLYRSLITNDTWARQRAEFGYRDVRPHYLIQEFCGQPYVDIRASLNSFVPAILSNRTAEKFIESYLCLLEDKPQLHDKIEFDVAFTIWTPSFESEAFERLSIYGVSGEQISEMGQALKSITKKAIFRLENDIKPIQSMVGRCLLLENHAMSPIDKAIILLSDCTRFGALAFAHAARAGFVAISFLKSLVTLGVITEVDKLAFLRSIKTITSEFEKDGLAVSNGELSKDEYINRYGHLRPGTYDASVEAYWEAPERYLFSKKTNLSTPKKEVVKFLFSKPIRNAIKIEIEKLDKTISYDSFIKYIVDAIQAREFVKFQFTQNLSLALDMIVKYGFELGIGREDIIYLNVSDLDKLKTGELSEINLPDLIEERKRKFAITQMIELPQLLFKESDFYCFERYASQVNFITLKRVEANIIPCSGEELLDFQKKIVLIPQADPGCNWLFDHNIAGLITKYGGANSHMAIRAAEMNLPAAIGVGEQLYDQLINVDRILLDCANQVIRQV